MTPWKVFWKSIEILLLIAGYIGLWDVAMDYFNAADWILFPLGVVLCIILLAAPFAIGFAIYERAQAAHPKK